MSDNDSKIKSIKEMKLWETSSMQPGDNWRPTKDARVTKSDLRDGVVLYDPRTQVVHPLDPVAALVWELTDGRTVAGIIQATQDMLDLTPEEASSWVDEALQEFCDLKVIS